MANIITKLAEALTTALLSSNTEKRQPGLATTERKLFIKDENSNEYTFPDDQHIRDVVNNYSANVGVDDQWGGDADNVYDALTELKTQSNLSGLTPDSYLVANSLVTQTATPNTTIDVNFETTEVSNNATFDGTEWVVGETGVYNIASAIWVNLIEPLTSVGTSEVLFLESDTRGTIASFMWAMAIDDPGDHPVSFTLCQNLEFTQGEKIKVRFTNGAGITPAVNDAVLKPDQTIIFHLQKWGIPFPKSSPGMLVPCSGERVMLSPSRVIIIRTKSQTIHPWWV